VDVGRVTGTKLELVGAGFVVVVVSATVVVVSGGSVVVAAGGVELPVERGTVVFTTGAGAVAVVPGGWESEPRVTGGASTLLDVELEEAGGSVDGMVTRAVAGGATVVVADWVATCCLGELSLPVATSKSRATSATEARAYSATLIR
jgi:hypothetical protein